LNVESGDIVENSYEFSELELYNMDVYKGLEHYSPKDYQFLLKGKILRRA